MPLESELRERYVDTLRGWLGRNEQDKSHRLIIDTYNSHKPLPRNYAVTYTDPWCAATVSAAAIEAGLTDIIPRECSCARMIELFKKMGRWMENDAYVPNVGDIIFYDWNDSGKGDCVGNPEHIGVVEKVADGLIAVIEGNYKDAVRRRSLKVNARFIRGYGIPNYASLADARKVRVTSDALRVRSDPDAESALVGYLEYGDAVTVFEERGGWGRLLNGNWIKLEFTECVTG